jgi:hypothetical protein
MRIPAIASLAAREPGGGTRSSQMPMLALTSRLSWPIVKPTPVPTRATRPSRARLPIPNSSPAASCVVMPLACSLTGPPPAAASTSPPASMPMASGKLLTCADRPAHCAGTK